jgi:hypothetical protein
LAIRSVCGGLLAALLLLAGANSARAQGWPGYSHDPQHTNLGFGPTQAPTRVRWSTAVDMAPQYASSGDLYIHYGSPLITRVNTVIVPVKTGQTGGFQVEALSAGTGATVWGPITTDYAVPQHDWYPIFGLTLTAKDAALVIPAAGGTVLIRTSPDSVSGSVSRVAFYGIANYNQNPTAFNNAIQISTPISADAFGNVYFGFVSNGVALPGYPSGITSGLARISLSGAPPVFVSAKQLSGDSTMIKVAYNSSPAFSSDGSTLYVAVNNVALNSIGAFGSGYLCSLNSTTLVRKSCVFLLDPRSSQSSAGMSDDSSATPTVGPDGDVYFGVLEAGFPSNHARGWLLHYNSTLTTTKLASAFGWDDTASIVPASLVPSYSGTSSYLLLTKYNNYADPGIGGDGVNKVAIVDPNASMTDPITGATVMNTVITAVGPTPDSTLRDASHPNAVREWCINAAAIDSSGKAAIVNSEDGHVYRWDFTTNTLSPGLYLQPPTGEAYTPTVIGPDGAIYAINNALLFSAVPN